MPPLPLPLRNAPRIQKTARGGADDVLANAIAVLEAIKDGASAVGGVPFVSGVVVAVLGIARAVEQVSGTREEFVQVAVRAAALTEHVQRTVGAEGRELRVDLVRSLSRLHQTMAAIRRVVEVELQRGRIDRFVRRASMATTLKKCVRDLDDAWHAFDTATMLGVELKLGEISGRIETLNLRHRELQLPLLFWDNVQIDGLRRRYRICDSHEGTSIGAASISRCTCANNIAQARVLQEDYGTLVRYHPDRASVPGATVLCLGDRCYISARGLQSDDPVVWVSRWFQHLLDFASVREFAANKADVPLFDLRQGQVHRHERCLPSIGLNPEGRLFLDVSDICHSHMDCFRQSISRMYSEARDLPASEDESLWFTSLPTGLAEEAIRVVCSNADASARGACLDRVVESDLGSVLSTARLECAGDARLGDYGYLKRCIDDGERFVRLGHISDLFEEDVLATCDRSTISPGNVWSLPERRPWSKGEVESHEFPRCLDDDEGPRGYRVLSVDRAIDPRFCRAFVWKHAPRVSRQHGILITQILLVDQVNHCAVFSDAHLIQTGRRDERNSHSYSSEDTRESANTDTAKQSRSLWFHQLPLDQDVQPPDPWGYWSEDSQPAPPDSSAHPNSPAHCRGCVTPFAYVSRLLPFEAELVKMVNLLRDITPTATEAIEPRCRDMSLGVPSAIDTSYSNDAHCVSMVSPSRNPYAGMSD
ncbi:uncharacterized protein BXZ73DRAFT_102230 [Epithele typhae]|uniref:uncharacterized protein n=1 Tax=Epithele typhae TaxID=378194 RepID=UPI0020087463|nr:uncharacterized protein BXZ73DRAFT_102230 [Epithele typhae]KAH9929076.1 hypothetical protein BXZ73DRAFT_102230 [Epithele typhae]